MATVLGANSVTGGYDVDNSVRLDGYDSSSRMEYTASNASNRRTWTWSAWIKRSDKRTNNFQVLFSSTPTGPAERIMFEGDKLTYDHDKSGTDFSVSTPGVLRDLGAWYHVVVMKDTTQSTETNRIKIYVNGVQQTLVEVQEGFPGQNLESTINTAAETQLFAQGDGEEFGGYACEVVFCDGQSLAADQFGEFDEDSGIWKPIDVSGLTFGTNGYYLNFADSSALGTDVSGNGNDYATANLAATDQSLDTCTNNFATMNTLVKSAATLSEGNLKQATAGKSSVATIGVTSGKWYFEQKFIGSGVNEATLGFALEGSGIFTNDVGGNTVRGTGYVTLYVYDGKIYNEGTATSSFATFAVNDIIGWNLDADAGDIFLYRNGSILNSGSAVVSGKTGKTWFPFGNFDTGDVTGVEHNFGGARTFSISSAVADGNGFGAFEFAPKSGHLAICTKNLAENG